MPQHRVPKGHLHEDLRSIEHDGEIVVSITPDPDDVDRFVVLTRYRGDTDIETRTFDGSDAA